MTTRVQLPMALREYTGGVSTIDVVAGDVNAVLRHLTERHPLLQRHLFTDHGELRGYVCLYLNEHDVRDLADGLHTRMRGDDVLLIVPSIAGGAEPAFSREETERYSRHFSLRELGVAGQQKLRAGRVVIIGAGGLGSPIGMYLAAAGVGTIGIVDFDVVDISNLQRQVLYTTQDVGRAKVTVAAERLRASNPHVNVITHEVKLTRDNALEILGGYDVVIDGTDNFPTRYLTSDASVLLGKPYVYGSILRFEGQVSVFTGRTGPCYRCLFREPPPPGLVPSCAEGGVLGVLPGIIGTLQALEAIKLITGIGDPLIGRLVLFDALVFSWRELRLRRNPECPVCGDQPTVTGLIDYDEFCGMGDVKMEGQSQSIPEITAVELKQRIDNGDSLVIIDVREPFEWDIANLEGYGAKLIPLDQVMDRRAEIDPDAEIVLHCRSGARSAGALRQLRQHGYTRMWNLKGGIRAWAAEIDPDMGTY